MNHPFTPVPKPEPKVRAKGRTRLRARSEKMAAKYAPHVVNEGEGEGEGENVAREGRPDLVRRLLLKFPLCQMGDKVQAWCAASPRARDRRFRCSRMSTEVHEKKRRSAGGDIMDEANCLATCHACHRWVHTNPKTAIGLGLLVSRYA